MCLPPKASAHYGGIGALVVCSKVSNSLQFVDPMTTKSFYMDVRLSFLIVLMTGLGFDLLEVFF